MSITIRLAKIGRKNAPAYRIVVANTKSKRNGKVLDILGHYNPSSNPTDLKIDKEKYTEWKNKGALSTKAIENLIAETYEYKKYEPNKKKEEATQTQPQNTKDVAVEEKIEETPSESTETQ